MADVKKEYLGKHKKFRIDNHKLATAFIVLAVVVAIGVFWWLKLIGITVTSEAFCGLDEHTHDSSCYASELICTYEYEEKVTPSDVEEPHIHTEECYDKSLACTKAEHVHSAECFPDKTADIETVSDWLATIDDVEITNNIPENLIEIAMTQLGYEESVNNFEYDENGNKNGYTRYGEWYGNPYGKWNTMFVSFCLHYSNINNDTVLKCAGAEAMRLAWQEKSAYADAGEHTPQRGDIVFFDTDSDSVADTIAIVISATDDSMHIILGDSNNAVEIKDISIPDNIIGYGLTSELHFSKDMEYEEEKEETTFPEVSLVTPGDVDSITFLTAEPELYSETDHNVTYSTDLTQFIVDVKIKTENNVEITGDSKVYIGQTYVITMEFKEDNEGEEWLQFGHNDQHYLTYHIPGNFECEPFTEWHSITAKTENGTIEDVGKYFIDENGYLLVTFYDDEDGVCFGHRYSNVDFIIEFNAMVGSSQSGESTNVKFNDQVNVDLNVDGGAGVEVSKTHGDYDSDNHTMDYIVTVEATHGLVKDFTLEDYTWNTHKMLKNTIVVTDLNGVPLNPQPTVGDQFTQGVYSGFSLTNFPDFAAGEGFLITYKTKVDDEYTTKESFSLGNGVYGAGKDSNGKSFGSYKEHWVTVEPEKMNKTGRQTALEINGQLVPVIEWRVVIKKNVNNLYGTVVIDTLGEGLQYFTGKDITIVHYDENGTHAVTETLSWNNVQINGNSMSFSLPEGYMYEIVYYTTYDIPDEGEQKNYTNSVSATINGKYETSDGDADVVSFIPRINKSASGNDGEYVYFTIEADVPAIIKDWGSFYLTDTASLWHKTNGSYFYVENVPENIVIQATTKSGKVVTFTPYVPGGPTENTYIIIAPAEGDLQHSFEVLFNTSTATKESSTWILNEDSVLTITYKLDFDSKTGTEWSGELTGDKTLGNMLLDNYILGNKAVLNYTNVVKDESTATYVYYPDIMKDSKLNADGTIEYTVLFHNSVPGTNNGNGYLSGAQNIIFTDTFDEKMEYVQGSLTVTCYDPWNSSRWLNKYKYNGTVSGNSMNISASSMVLDHANEAVGEAWNIPWLESLTNYQIYCNSMGGGDHIFTYKLKLKDEYLYSTEESKYELTNTAEIKWNGDNTSGPASETIEYKTGLLDKSAVQGTDTFVQDGKEITRLNDKIYFSIHINSNALDILPDIDKLTIEDTMTENLSIYWDSIKLFYEDQNGQMIDFDSAESQYDYSVTYDQATNCLTFVVPDSLHVRVDYTTLVTQNGLVSVGNSVKINASATITDVVDAVFKIEQHSGGASASMNSITLLKQDGETDVPLPYVTFHMYGPKGDLDAALPQGVPESIEIDNGKKLRYIGSYTTGADGTVKISSQYLTNGGPYALVEQAAPQGYNKLEKPVYFYYYNIDPNGIIQTVTTLIAVENYQYGFVLPETGGIGTLPLAIIGFALMLSPVLYSKFRRKRERRLT